MFDSLNISHHISFLVVFIEGLLSFLSPCILPLIPIYISYLAGNAKKTLQDGSITYERKKVFFHTLCFCVGICVTFFLLGLSFTALGKFFASYQHLFTKIGGIIIIILGLFQLGIFNFKFLQKQRNLNFDISNKEINPLIAFVMGFTFSFAWTPCVGPALSSVLILASSTKTVLIGNVLVFVYSLGFILPFLLLGLFTSKVLNFFNKNKKIINYTIKISGVLLIIIGIMTFTGYINGISSYLNKTTVNNTNSTNTSTTEAVTETTSQNTQNQQNADNASKENELPDAFDFTLTDQYGNSHTLSDYKGKVVFLNFWATWCNPCLIEMPHIEELYNEYGLNKEDVVILGIANPRSDEYPYNADEPKETIIDFLNQNGYTFPILFDETGEISKQYFVRAFPTTYMINKEGQIYGYVPGSLTKDIMKNIIEDTLNSTQNNNN